MSKLSYIEKLLDGAEVAWLPLGEVINLSSGSAPSPIYKYLTDDNDGVPLIRIGDSIPGSKYIEKTEKKITREGSKNSTFLKKGAFIFSKSMSYGRPYILKIDGVIQSGWASFSGFEKILNKDYLYYYLSTSSVKKYWLRKVKVGEVGNLNNSDVKSLKIPIPCLGNPEKSLAIQAEIARILDAFTALTAELTTELSARKKQYNYYRDQLLSFEDGGVEWLPLKDILVRTKGTKITAGQMGQLHKDGAPLKIFAGGKTIAFVDFEDIPPKDINRKPSVIVKSRGVIEFEYYDKPFSHKNEMWSYHSDNNCLSIKYVYHFLKLNEPHFRGIASRMQMPQIAIPDTDKYRIPIPCPDNPQKSLKIQAEIARILDKFDTLTNSISEGLPREIELRQKQYEYYRDLLFVFR